MVAILPQHWGLSKILIGPSNGQVEPGGMTWVSSSKTVHSEQNKVWGPQSFLLKKPPVEQRTFQ
jgi:hypothetical protein